MSRLADLPAVVRRTGWELFHRLVSRRHYPQRLRLLQADERLSAGELEALRRERLSALLRHAAAHVPYYSEELHRAGVVDGAGRVHLDRFSEIRPLDKAAIRGELDRLIDRKVDRRRLTMNSSGGSTGTPVRFAQSVAYGEWSFAAALLTNRWAGYRLGERRAILWGAERDLFYGKETPWVRLARAVRNELWLNAFAMSEARMSEYVEAMRRFRPVQVLAYAESAYELARFAETTGRRVYAPRSIITSAGTLHSHMRDTIERVFRAPVFNRYGSREVGPIAAQCERRDGLHVMAPTTFVELLRPDGSVAGPGEEGEVLVTLLTNHAMPLIRYRIGDVAAWADGRCACGRSWPRLSGVHGRVSDVFVARDGARIHGEYFTHLMYFRDWVSRFQVVQETPEYVRFLIVPAAGTGDVLGGRHAAEIAEIEDRVRRVLGGSCRIAWEVVEDIPPAPSGKRQFTISRVAYHRTPPGLAATP